MEVIKQENVLYVANGLRRILLFCVADVLLEVVKTNAVYVIDGPQRIPLWFVIATEEFVQNVEEDSEVEEKLWVLKKIMVPLKALMNL